MSTRTTIYLDSRVHKALKIRAAQMSMSISDVVSEALLHSLKEDAIDLQIFAFCPFQRPKRVQWRSCLISCS